MGLLPVTTTITAEKTTRQVTFSGGMDGDEFIKAFVICDVAFDDVFHFLSFL